MTRTNRERITFWSVCFYLWVDVFLSVSGISSNFFLLFTVIYCSEFDPRSNSISELGPGVHPEGGNPDENIFQEELT
jgi:hypothetical membrane protein